MRTYRVIRALAIALGLFLLATSVLDITGVVPYSETPPSFKERISHSVLRSAAGIALLLPYRKMKTRAKREFGIIAIAVTLFWGSRAAGPAISGYLHGTKSWLAVVVSAVFLLILVANAWAFRQFTGAGGSAG